MVSWVIGWLINQLCAYFTSNYRKGEKVKLAQRNPIGQSRLSGKQFSHAIFVKAPLW